MGVDHPAEQIAAQMLPAAEERVAALASAIEVMLGKARDLGEFRMMLSSAYAGLDTSALADMIATGLIAAHAAGRSDAEDVSERRTQ